jgi:CHASE3 domain sensor protein
MGLTWSIRAKVRIGAAAVLGVVVAVDGLSYAWLTQLIRTADSVTESYENLDDLDHVLLELQNAETGQRGYIFTGEEIYLEPYHAATQSLDSHLASLDPPSAVNRMPADPGGSWS